MKSELYLLDTNRVSYILRGRPAGARRRVESLGPGERVAVSVITEAEIRYGLRKRPVRPATLRATEDFLDRLEVLPWTSEVARACAELRAGCETRGVPLGNLYMLIAAQAIAAEAILVTNDKTFRHVGGSLLVEDWTG